MSSPAYNKMPAVVGLRDAALGKPNNSTRLLLLLNHIRQSSVASKKTFDFSISNATTDRNLFLVLYLQKGAFESN